MGLSAGDGDGGARGMHGGRIILALAAMLAVGAGLARWGQGGQAEWPPIADPAGVRRAATILCRGAGGWRELQPSEYPAALVALHPASVSVSRERVYVALVPTPGGRTRFHGYFVWPETADRPDGGIEREESNQRSDL